MISPECQQWLQERLDGQLAPNHPSVVKHLVECPACREWHAAARLLEDGLRRLPVVSPPVGLVDHLMARVLSDRRRRLVRRRLLAVTSLAAGVLLVVGMGYFWPSPPLAPQRVESPQIVEIKPEPIPAPLSVHKTMSEAGIMVAELARKTSGETFSPSLFSWTDTMIDTPTLTGTDTLQQTWEPPAQELRAVGQGASTSLQPVTTSAKRAVSLFLRDWTTAEQSKTSF